MDKRAATGAPEGMAANAFRLRRLGLPGAILMVPLDHGVSDGPLAGLANPWAALEAARSAATCVTMHKGLVARAAPHSGTLGILLHLSAGTPHGGDRHDKRLVATVEEALRLGCDGVSLHLNLGAPTEARQIEEAGRVSTACQEWGMPLVAMVYPRGPSIPDPAPPALVAHAARLGAELGADAVKVPFTGSEATFREVVAGCPVPVLVAGGAQRAFPDLLTDLNQARRAGAAGASVGRNVFQAPDPKRALQEIAKVFS
ncbi:MAG: 2-amino-3,7-dideoxy-D-threo-hept-6-ulosonate synthase [Thermoplasmatota archaeon]